MLCPIETGDATAERPVGIVLAAGCADLALAAGKERVQEHRLLLARMAGRRYVDRRDDALLGAELGLNGAN